METFNVNNTAHQSKKMALIQHILEENMRVFRRGDLQDNLPELLKGVSYQAVSNLLNKLVASNWLAQVKKGIYEVVNTATPIHEYEIAVKLVTPAAVSHRTAFYYHGLTDQVLHCVYLTTLNTRFVPTGDKTKSKRSAAIIIRGVEYIIVRLQQEKFFGHKIAWVGDGNFQITDLERTLLDGLAYPQYCGGLQEVIYAFEESFEKINLDKIIEYGMCLDTAVSRRLGWVLDNILNIGFDKINCLAKKEQGGYRLLDANCKSQGEYDSKWGIRQNHHY
jgi:predicted transcriptional regulator of viral defense system